MSKRQILEVSSMKARKLISILLILMFITTTGFASSPAYGSEGTAGTSGDNRTVKDIPSDSSADTVSYDTAKFSNDYIKTPNTDIGFFVNTTSQKAYRVPASTGTFTGQASSDLSVAMLKDVFGISKTFGPGYHYAYDAGYLSIYKNVEFQSTKGTVDEIYSQLEQFKDNDGNSLIAALASFYTSNKLNTLKYEYTNDKLTIMQPGIEPADDNHAFNMDFTADDIGAFISLADGTKGFPTNLNWGTNDALALSYEQISDIANDSNGTYSAEEKALAQKILDQVGTIFSDRTTKLPGITSGDIADLKIRVIDIIGVPGIDIIYPSTKPVEKPFPDASATSPTTYENKPVAKAHYNDTDYKPATPKYVFNGLNTYGLSYCLPGNSLEWTVTRSTINAGFLRTVFPAADEDITKLLAEMNLNPDKAYKITISSFGYLQITHEEPIPSYEIKWVMDNGNLIETTSVKEGEVPVHADPTKAAIAEYSYTFSGWYPEVKAATEDTVYVATFSVNDDAGEEYKTVKNAPADDAADAVAFDTAKFSNDYIKTPNTDVQFFVNDASQKAYRVPASTGTFTGQASSDLSAAMLKDVFGISKTFGTGYHYAYDAGYLSIYKNVEFQSTKGTVDEIYSQLEQFKDNDGNSLIAALASFYTSNKLNTLKYEYTNDKLTIMQPGIEPADDNHAFNMDFTADDIGAFISLADGTKGFPTNLNWGTNDALALSYEQISDIANDSNGTYSAEEKALAQKILDQVGTIFSDRTTKLPGITSGDIADLKIRVIDIIGVPGIDIIYPSTKPVEKPFPDASATSPTTYENKPVAKAHYNDTDYKPATPKYVFNGLNTYGLSYYLPNYSLEWIVTKSTVNADLLRAVFPAADKDITKLLAEMDLNPNRAYKITVSSTGYLQITHKELIRVCEIKWVMDNGDLIETTSVKEGEVPKYTGKTPVKEADSQYTYTFDSWTPEITAATGDTEYKAVFTAKENTYSIVSQSTNSQSTNSQGLTWKKGSGQEFTITVKQDGDIDRSFEDFTGVKMNGSLLERDKDYKASKGSTIITVSSDTLEKLTIGENTLTVQFAYGEVSVQINVLEADKPVIDSPRTGDPVSPFTLMFIMAISAAAIAMIIAMRKRITVQ